MEITHFDGFLGDLDDVLYRTGDITPMKNDNFNGKIHDPPQIIYRYWTCIYRYMIYVYTHKYLQSASKVAL